ncbi:MAG: radical SAM protein [Candidatus Methanofastidiosia archaeon]|jgi:oxygen-independent coproporphyrinogen-3 oxidase
MITEMSTTMMKKSFEKTLYEYGKIPKASLNGSFGVYIHVPFCYSLCSFCPFYKEIYSQTLKDQYLAAIQKEIDTCNMTGTAHWVYMGGGTPNTLSIKDLSSIVQHLTQKVTIETMGIELLPALVTEEYLKGLHTNGFTKVSIGVESFAQAMSKTGRKTDTKEHIQDIIETAQSENLWVNTDIMVGLPGQDQKTFLQDIKTISHMNPDQVTIYPFMMIRGVLTSCSMPDIHQFTLIEKAHHILSQSGYTRKGVWTFAKGDTIYDSSRDELVQDYIGFGPAAFSTYNGLKIVNPGLTSYLKNINNPRGFISAKSTQTDNWRVFARMIYDLQCQKSPNFPGTIRLFIKLLEQFNYCKNGVLTKKGILFAHAITKTVVESLPFPLQNPDCVKNYDEYLLDTQK